MHRYGADCFSAASYFYTLSPRGLSVAIDTALKQSTDEMLFMRWCTSGLQTQMTFADFRAKIVPQNNPAAKKQTAADILADVEKMMNNTKWGRADGC